MSIYPNASFSHWFKTMNATKAPYDAIPCGEGGKWKGPRKTLLFNIAHRVAYRVPLTKLVKLYGA